MTGRLRAFFAKRSAQRQKRIDEEYTTMTAGERAEAEAGSHGGAAGGADVYDEREAEHDEDAWEGKPPREM